MRRLVRLAGLLLGVGVCLLATYGVPHAQFSQFVPGASGVAFTQAISFRATSGAITDAEKQGYSLASGDSGNYPIAPICNGCVSAGDSTGVGWVSKGSISALVNNAGWSLVLRGSNFTSSGVTQTYKINVPTGALKFYVAFGQAAATPSAVTITLLDGATTLATIAGASPGASNVIAADDIAYGVTAGGTWDTTGVTKFTNITMVGTVLSVQVGGASFNGIEWLKVTNQ